MSWPGGTVGIFRGLHPEGEDDDGASGVHQLCETCASLRFDFKYPDEEFLESASLEDKTTQTPCVKHHDSVSKLIESALDGCHICTLMVVELYQRIVYQDLKEDFLAPNLHVLALLKSTFLGSVYISTYEHRKSLIVHDGKSGLSKAHLSLSTTSEIAELQAEDKLRKSYDGRYGILEKFDKCRGSHESCEEQARVSLPARLIDISLGIEALKLVTLKSQRAKRKGCRQKLEPGYATVSHRWLPKLSCKTTAHNIKKYHKLIPADIVPAHFRDAILLTRALGLHFLWIDSLCIVQEGDDGADWDREAFKMASIYRGAAINISIDIKDALRGFLPINLREIRPCQLRAIPGRLIVPQIPANQRALDLGGLETRGWILQERLLARRIIHCTPWGLLWECYQQYDGFEEHSFERKNLRRDTIHASLTSGIPAIGAYEHAQLTLFNTWIAVVEKYSRRDLTVVTDMLVAIAGLARQIEFLSSQPLSYLGGMWMGDAVCQLAWFTERAGTKRGSILESIATRPLKGLKKYRAPSFSWASVDCEISFAPRKLLYGPDYQAPDVQNSNSTLKVLSHWIQSNGDPLGMPIAASITLKSLSAVQKDYCKITWVVPDGEKHAEVATLGCSGMVTMDDEINGWMYQPDQLPESASLFMLGNFPMIVALVLVPFRRKENRFRRIGLWQLSYEESSWKTFNYSAWTDTTVTII